METTSTLRLPYSEQRLENREISKQHWGVLINSVFPGANSEDAILNAWDLAKVRGLDIFSGHIAIVSKRRKVDNNWVEQESSWLTLKALVFTAHKTGAFAGIDPIKIGPMVEHTFDGYRYEDGRNVQHSIKVTAPEYVTATVYRFVDGQRCAFSDTLFFSEAVALSQGLPTSIWEKKPTLMLSKCAKAAALRLGFAECDYSADEMEGQELSSDIIPGQVSNVHTLAGPSSGHNGKGPQPTGGFPGDVQSEQELGDVVINFDQLPGKTLKWLDRNVTNAISIGAFDEAVDNIKGTLQAETHQIGERLVRAAETISSHPEGSKLWDFIGKARDHGGDAFDAAMTQINAKAENGQLPDTLSTASGTHLTFLKALKQAA